MVFHLKKNHINSHDNELQFILRKSWIEYINMRVLESWTVVLVHLNPFWNLIRVNMTAVES